MSTSCFDCLNLKYHPNPEYKDLRWWCGEYDVELHYRFAKQPNNCPRKKQYEDSVDLLQFPQYESLIGLYKACIEVAEYLERPFTIRELSERVAYLNRNSLWMLLEKLIAAGKIEKDEIASENMDGRKFTTKIYFPKVWVENDIVRSESA